MHLKEKLVKNPIDTAVLTSLYAAQCYIVLYKATVHVVLYYCKVHQNSLQQLLLLLRTLHMEKSYSIVRNLVLL